MRHSSNNARNRRPQTAAALVENLEPRRLLAVTLSNGVLTITGFINADRIEVQRRADDGEVRVEHNGQEFDFPIGSVTRVVIDGRGGNDFIQYSGRDGGLNIPGVINGGTGNDTITGGDANDTLIGGNGHDSIEGKSGNDRIAGGKGNDTIQGGNGNDSLNGDQGHDDLWGNRGDDNLDGGLGDDDLSGGRGTDNIFGDFGNDDFDTADSFSEQLDLFFEDGGVNINP
jgi:Ca2+-binding RTX toxin-like protein